MSRASRFGTLYHVNGAALARCRAIMVDHDLQTATLRAARLGTADEKRRAASRYARHVGFLFDDGERDLDVIADAFFSAPMLRRALLCRAGAREGRLSRTRADDSTTTAGGGGCPD